MGPKIEAHMYTSSDLSFEIFNQFLNIICLINMYLINGT